VVINGDSTSHPEPRIVTYTGMELKNFNGTDLLVKKIQEDEPFSDGRIDRWIRYFDDSSGDIEYYGFDYYEYDSTGAITYSDSYTFDIQYVDFPLTVGKSWTYDPNGRVAEVVSVEDINTGVGLVSGAYKVRVYNPSSTFSDEVFWFHPSYPYYIKYGYYSYSNGALISSDERILREVK
jgi:hypothetical protein